MSTLVYSINGEVSPSGTLTVNITGAFLIGFLAEPFGILQDLPDGASPKARDSA